jgi:hypothetical protein
MKWYWFPAENSHLPLLCSPTYTQTLQNGRSIAVVLNSFMFSDLILFDYVMALNGFFSFCQDFPIPNEGRESNCVRKKNVEDFSC